MSQYTKLSMLWYAASVAVTDTGSFGWIETNIQWAKSTGVGIIKGLAFDRAQGCTL